MLQYHCICTLPSGKAWCNATLMRSDLQIQCTNAMYSGHNTHYSTVITEAKMGRAYSNKQYKLCREQYLRADLHRHITTNAKSCSKECAAKTIQLDWFCGEMSHVCVHGTFYTEKWTKHNDRNYVNWCWKHGKIKTKTPFLTAAVWHPSYTPEPCLKWCR